MAFAETLGLGQSVGQSVLERDLLAASFPGQPSFHAIQQRANRILRDLIEEANNLDRERLNRGSEPVVIQELLEHVRS